MRWFGRRRRPEAEDPALIQVFVTTDEETGQDEFVCADCGRRDLPPAGDWDPPICQECDAAINFDAIEEATTFDPL